jgi:hypothetical protein
VNRYPRRTLTASHPHVYPANTQLCRVRRKRRKDHTSVSGRSWTTCSYRDVEISATKLSTRMKSKCINAGRALSQPISGLGNNLRERILRRELLRIISIRTLMYLRPHSHSTTAPRNLELPISIQQIPQLSAAIIPSSDLHRLMQTTTFCFETRRVPILPTKASCLFA